VKAAAEELESVTQKRLTKLFSFITAILILIAREYNEHTST